LPKSKKNGTMNSSSNQSKSRKDSLETKARGLSSNTLERESKLVEDDEIEGKEEFEKENS